jgi:dTDP-glucose 4,6-dehydratase
MKILVTGGAGFIGSNFLHYMIEKHTSYDLTCLDKLTYAANLNNISDLISSNKVRFVHGDIADGDFIKVFFSQNSFDIVVNFAAESHVDRSISSPKEFLESNYIGVFNLLEEVRHNKKIRFHQVSTDEVYGDLPLERSDMLFTEESRFNPSSPYSATKAAADHLIRAYYRTYGIHATISHSSNNYGPYQFTEKLIPLVITKAINNETVPVYGNGLNVRDWVYVVDHCIAIDNIIHRGRKGESYNVGGGNEYSNLQVVNAILDYLGSSKSLIKFVPDRAGHDLRYALNVSKIAKDLNWQPKISFRDGIKLTIQWYLENEILHN